MNSFSLLHVFVKVYAKLGKKQNALTTKYHTASQQSDFFLHDRAEIEFDEVNVSVNIIKHSDTNSECMINGLGT